MKRGFTLIELLVVMGIMGIMGTLSVGGYRAMQRGMEERGVMESVNSLIRTAYQRAQIDRQPVAIYFWNETIRSETDDHNAIVIGRAVAIRRYGRFSDVRDGMLVDEFADLDQTYRCQATDDDEGNSSRDSNFFIYPIEKLSEIETGGKLKRTLVEGKVKRADDNVLFLSGTKSDDTAGENIPAWGFVIVDQGGVTWKRGMAYGMEFMSVELPHNYIFTTSFSRNTDDPVTEAGTIVFDVGMNSGNGLTTGGARGRKRIDVCSLRPNGTTVKAEKVATSDSPDERLKENE